jgi:hypothetical protein
MLNRVQHDNNGFPINVGDKFSKFTSKNLNINRYEIDIFDIGSVAYYLPSPVQNRLPGDSFSIFPSFRQDSNKMFLPPVITVIEFICCHVLRLHPMFKLSSESCRRMIKNYLELPN